MWSGATRRMRLAALATRRLRLVAGPLLSAAEQQQQPPQQLRSFGAAAACGSRKFALIMGCAPCSLRWVGYAPARFYCQYYGSATGLLNCPLLYWPQSTRGG